MAQATLRQLAFQYVRERQAIGDLAPTTVPNVRYTLLLFADFVGDLPPRRLTATHIEQWMASSRHSKGTARNHLSRVKLFCRWLVRRGYLQVDPTADIKPPKPPRPVPRSIPAAEITALISTLPDSRSRFICVWMCQLGLRTVEVSRLELGDVDMEQRSVLIHGKGGWQRLLPITEEAWSVLVSYLVEHPTRSGPLVRSLTEPWRGIQPATITRLVSRWMREADVKGTAHGLRHSAASHLLRGQGADLRDVQDVLGHQSLTSTSVYLPHSDLPRLREVMEGRRYMDPPAEAG